MATEMIKSLLEALEVSPDNVPLRLQLGKLMLQEGLSAEAAVQFQAVLERSYGHEKAQLGLAEAYMALHKYAAASII